MFVCSLKLTPKLISKIIFIIIFIIVIVIAFMSCYKIFHYEKVNDTLVTPKVTNITTNNYTNILKSVHDNLDKHIGQKIHFTGYVYRVYDFSETEFVLARNMLVSSDNQTVVVGFLCNYKNAIEFSDNTWVEITGKITKGNYHGDIPVIEISEMKKIDKPVDEYVYPPDDTYIPTSALF